MSFLKKNESPATSPATPTKIIRSTGGYVDGVVMSLIQAANDNTPEVVTNIATALKDLGLKQPHLVLSSCVEFIQSNQKKIIMRHRITLLNVMNEILTIVPKVKDDLGLLLSQFFSFEMTCNKEIEPEWQEAACRCLVTLSATYPQYLLDEMLKRFEQGVIPHFFVLKALSEVATVNPLALVPRLKETLSKMLPLLALIKHDNYRWGFATAIANFGEAVSTYAANMDQVTDKSIGLLDFDAEFFTAYDFMFVQWLNGREQKVRLSTVRAIGCCSSVIKMETLEQHIQRIVRGLFGLWIKEKDQDRLPLTQGLSALFESATRNSSQCLEPLLREILPALFPVGEPITTSPATMKNYNEVLRCFEILGRSFVDQVIAVLLQKLETPNPAVRIGGLAVMKHMVTRLDDVLVLRKPILVSGLKAIISDKDYSVRKAVSQVVISMASNGYLSLEGGENLVESIVRNCAITDSEIAQYRDMLQKTKREREPNLPQELRTMCNHMIHLMTSTIPEMENVLWPYIFETIVPIQYTDALAITSKCLAEIGMKKRKEGSQDYIIDFDRKVNLPRPVAVISRFFVMLSVPLRRDQLGQRIIQALIALGALLHPALPELWELKLPKVLQYLEANKEAEGFQDAWDDLLLRLLGETMDRVNDDEWIVSLGESFEKQADLYAPDDNLRRQLSRFIGMAMQKSTNKTFIRSKLDFLFNSVNHSFPLARQGCAQAYGLTSVSHLDQVLEKLQSIVKVDLIPKSTGFLGLSKDKSDADIECMKATLILSFGNVASSSPVKLIASRVEIHILNHITPLIPTCRSPLLRESMINTIELVARAVHPSRLPEQYTLKPRDQLMTSLLLFMGVPIPDEKGGSKENTNAGSANIPPQTMATIRASGLSAATALVLLLPVLDEALESKGLSNILTFLDFNEKVEPAQVTLLKKKMDELFAAVLFMNTNIACLCRLLKYIEPWVSNEKVQIREKALETVVYILQKFVEYSRKKAGQSEKMGDNTFVNFGGYLSVYTPRCTDSTATIRDLSMRATQTLLYIRHMITHPQKQIAEGVAVPESVQEITEIRGRVKENDEGEHYAAMGDLAKVLGTFISEKDLPDYLHAVVALLTDKQPTSSSGTAVILNALIKIRGAELKEQVPKLVSGMLSSMEGITNPHATTGTLHTTRTLARFHLVPVLQELLGHPVPHPPNVVKMLQIIAKTKDTVEPMTKYLLDVINNQQPYEEKFDLKKKGPSARVLCPVPNSAIAALGDMFLCEELETHGQTNYPSIVCTFLMRLGPVNGLGNAGQYTKEAVECFLQYLRCVKDDPVANLLSSPETKARLENPDYYESITELVNVICKKHKEHMKAMHEFMFPYLSRTFPGQRIVAVTSISEFINHAPKGDPLIQQYINCLLTRLSDDDLTARLVTFRGLGNAATLNKQDLNRYSNTLMNALMTGMDLPEDVLAMESMNSMSRIFAVIEEEQVSPIIVNITMRLKPLFDKQTTEVRAAAFGLFGTLSRFGGGAAAPTFKEQLQACLPCFVVHINDESTEVIKSCKRALRQLIPLFGISELDNFFNMKAFDEFRVLEYETFLQEISKLLVSHFPDRMPYYMSQNINYYKSTWPVIRANAVLFTGFLVRSLGNANVEARRNIMLDQVSRTMTDMIHDSVPLVRSKTALALSLIYDV